MAEHYFLIENLAMFLANLQAKGYSHATTGEYIAYMKNLSNALIKHYAYSRTADKRAPVQIRVTYEILNDGKPLKKLVKELNAYNRAYRATLPVWKTKQEPNKKVRDRRWHDLQRFFHKHGELIYCFKYKGDERLTEGNYLFNLQIASTPLSLPAILTGSIVGIAIGWEAVIGAEIIVHASGFGSFIKDSATSGIDRPAVAGMFVILVLVFTLNRLVWAPLLAESGKRYAK
jgi:hypothetical protein